MAFANPFSSFAFGDLFDTVLPDFVLAFAFFTAVIYAVLSRRFGQQRPAVVMSAALGMVLSVGLVWWEYDHGLSIRNLGPVAVGFAVIILAGVMYQAIRNTGGSWAGAGIALGASVLVGWLLGIDWRLDARIVQTVIAVALSVGVIAFLLHHGRALSKLAPAGGELGDIRHDVGDLRRNRRVSKKLTRGFRQVRKKADSLFERPQQASDVMLQLRRMLPAEGWLTQRMARLRERVHHIRKGNLIRIEELRETIEQLPVKKRRKAAVELTKRYQEAKLDVRVERLDRTVAETERRVRELTRRAQEQTQQHDFKGLTGVLKEAETLQKHNAKLIRLIELTEKRLLAIATEAAQQHAGVSDA